MLSKLLTVFVSLFFLSAGVFYFVSNSSYQDSLEARFYYFIGNYQKAYTLAKKAYENNLYNKMAFTVLTQSKKALEYEDYINRGNAYLKKIDLISSNKKYNEADKIRIKMMCEIMIEDYKKLSPTKLTDSSLTEGAKEIYRQFRQLYNELFK